MTQPCSQLETIGKLKEFMDSIKGFRITLASIVVAIVAQIITFGFLWGAMTTTVNSDNKQIWTLLTPTAMENQRNIDKILAKFELISVIQGARGATGAAGAAGKDYYK